MREQHSVSFFLLTRHDGGVEFMQCVGDTLPPDAMAKWPDNRHLEIASWRPITLEDYRVMRAARSRGEPIPEPTQPIPPPLPAQPIVAGELEETPPFLPLPVAPSTGQREFSLQDLLKNADMEGGPIEVPPLPAPAQPIIEPALPPVPVEDALSEATRRRAAKATVRKAVADVNRVTNDQYLLYHQAMLVRNKNVKAMTEMEIAAAVKGVTVQQLADQIITEWEARVRRASYVYALEAQAMKDIDAARGEDIDEVARKAAAEIAGEDE